MSLTEIKKTAITKGWLRQAEKYLCCCGEDRQSRKPLILRDLSEICSFVNDVRPKKEKEFSVWEIVISDGGRA